MSDAPALALATDPSPKRRRILDAASELFVANGYGAVTMDAVARAASVSKATLYAHFGSKDALFATIIDEACRANLADDALFPDAGEDILAALTAIGERTLRFLLSPRTQAIYRVVVSECARFPELGRALYENGPVRFRAALAKWLGAEAAIGHLAVPDTALAAEHFMGLLRAGPYIRGTVGMAVTDAEIVAAAEAAAATFLRAFGV
jgi:TetR/AcrR family transcriptional repressor of mexJK operon